VKKKMRRITWALLLIFASTPALAGKKISVSQLEDLLRSMQQDKKSDVDMSTSLKQVELSEELTRSRMNGLVRYVSGPLATEQIYVLEARSASMAPPVSDLPPAPGPDAAAQKVMLAKTGAYVSGIYAQLPSLTATRTTIRFQDNVEAVAASSGITGSATEVVTTAGFSNAASFIHYINSTEEQVAIQHGAEQRIGPATKTPWGANKMIALMEPDPSLVVVHKEAEESGTIEWLRWELVNGKQMAVYSFAVPKKQSRLELDVCCFPVVKQAGIATFYTALTAPTLGAGGSGGGVAGNFQTNTDWHNFKTTAPYHGKFFVDPETGIVVRMIVEAELNPSDVVHQVDTRIDYGAIKVRDNVLIVPVKTFINTEVVPNGDSGSGGYKTRRTLFTSEYKNYQPGSLK
jgi:hypothetical protein